jgi:RNA polymerase sigma factor (sigma-70 family)
MQEPDDQALLREFVERDSEPAFAGIVARHLNQVYSVALRHTRNPHQAEEIAQAVFVILARKARRLGPRVNLSGWLYETARLTAVTLIRGEIRRARRQQEALMQTLPPEPETEVWPQIAPLLDAAMARLNATDRHALVLRFFDGKTMREIGAALGGSEDAAKMRVNRAVEKLRRHLARHGVMTPAAALAAAVSAHSVQAAPGALAQSISSTAVTIANGSAAPAAITTLVKGTMKTMTWLKLKFAAGAGLVALLAGGAATVALSGNGTDGAGGAASSVFQLRLVQTNAGAGTETLTNTAVDKKSGRTVVEVLNVQNKVLLDRSAVRSASVVTNAFIGRPEQIVVDFNLTPAAKQQFAKITRDHVGERLAIMVDGKLISAPRIASEIPNGQGQITGNFTAEEAARLAAMIGDPERK